jgi:hypothetical protein
MALGSFYHDDFYYFLCVTQAISGGVGGGRREAELSWTELSSPTLLTVWPPSLMAVGRSARRFVSHSACSCKITDFKKAGSVRVKQIVSPFVRFHVDSII